MFSTGVARANVGDASPALQDDKRKPLIIALDQDNFYCGVERILNPALRGVPVGVRQKGLLATTSYEARAMGVKKLMSLREAMEKCPSMVLVDGEDLSKYREYSRRVAKLVNSLIGADEDPELGVEKLGMDEVFLDVTHMVHSHLESHLVEEAPIPPYSVSPPYRTYRKDELGSMEIYCAHPPTVDQNTGASLARGFWYNPTHPPGHIHISPPTTSPSLQPLIDPPLLLASHIAFYIRSQITTQIGLSSSGGIAHNKLLAKLIGNFHKPDDQTTLLAVGEEGVQDFLDGMNLRALNGFGAKIVQRIGEFLGKPVEEESLNRHGYLDGVELNMAPTDMDPKTDLTIRNVRTSMSLPQFIKLFDTRLGTRLWALLHGIDDDPVHPAPEYPKQIGVEDSYATTARREYRVIRAEMEVLVANLIRRLEEELLLSHPGSGKKTWLRWPRQFRLSLRRDWEMPGGREMRSTLLPAFVFDLEKSVEERASGVMKKVGEGLLHELLGVSKATRGLDDRVFEVYVINVAVTNLSITEPPRSILSAFSDQPKSPTIDLDFIRSMPRGLRRELMAKYGLTEEDLAQHNEGKGEAMEVDEDGEVVDHGEREVVLPTAEEDEFDDEEAGEGGGGELICSRCGMEVFDFARNAHNRWHESE